MRPQRGEKSKMEKEWELYKVCRGKAI